MMSKLDCNTVAADSVEIREVWDSNLEEEFSLIRSIVHDYPFVAMDTEFPRIVHCSYFTFRPSFTEFNYQTLKINVNNNKLIQVGLTFFDSSGRLPLFGSPPRPCVWQFTFREFYAASNVSTSYFEKKRDLGVTATRFAKLIVSSGIVMNDSIKWITFHGCYDFGYLIKMLTSCDLPDSHKRFFHSLRLYFPKTYDIKHLMLFCSNLYGGLNKIAEQLRVKRVGPCHQAGSDSLLTAATYVKWKHSFSDASVEKYVGVLHGLSVY